MHCVIIMSLVQVLLFLIKRQKEPPLNQKSFDPAGYNYFCSCPLIFFAFIVKALIGTN